MYLPRLGPSAAALGALLAVAAPANASLTLNGLSLNGLTLNALTVNALTSNALTSNALLANAVTSNSLSFNAVVAAGSVLGELNGIAVEAVILPDQPSR